MVADFHQASESSPQPARRASFSWLPSTLTMPAESQRPKGRDEAISLLDEAIADLNRTKELSTAKAVPSCVGALLEMIKVRFLLFYIKMARIHM